MINKNTWHSLLSEISHIHYIKLIERSIMLIVFAAVCIMDYTDFSKRVTVNIFNHKHIFVLIGIIFAVEMVMRFFPSGLESMGNQKQFNCNYEPLKRNTSENGHHDRSHLIVAVSWIIVNSVFGCLYLTEIISASVLILISLFYSVCDIICILFYCPFQEWIMKNKCCGTCRIYNWDYAMMFTPLVFIKNIFTWGLFGLGAALLIQWEIIYHRHPERFSEKSNANLSCVRCNERLCRHKKTIRKFISK
ncbi:MAG: hypothetical protein Q4F95_03330 [Oscillospiraceae bacterium]|nr:hypothetical protein [Oscillospiraceae bacterium]